MEVMIGLLEPQWILSTAEGFREVESNRKCSNSFSFAASETEALKGNDLWDVAVIPEHGSSVRYQPLPGSVLLADSKAITHMFLDSSTIA